MAQALSFDHLVERFGEITAWHCLAEIERAARMRPRSDETDAQGRLSLACALQDMQSNAIYAG